MLMPAQKGGAVGIDSTPMAISLLTADGHVLNLFFQ